MHYYISIIFIFRKQENIESRKTDIKIISHKNTEGIVDKDGIHSFCPSSQSSLVNKVLKSKCKVDAVPPTKTPNDSQKLFTVEPCLTKNLQLETEQYINIFNRYQVYKENIIFVYKF